MKFGMQKMQTQKIRDSVIKYIVGYKALLITSNLKLKLPRKLQKRNVGPFEVLKWVGPNFYKLNIPQSAALKTIHSFFYFSLHKDFVDYRLRQQSPPIKVYGEYNYEIEAILGYQSYKGQPQELVKAIIYYDSENI